jgi:hypothetical protein
MIHEDWYLRRRAESAILVAMKKALTLCFGVCVLLSVAASATSIDLTGSNFTIASKYFNGATTVNESRNVVYGPGLEVTDFSWMNAGDSIDLFRDFRNEIGVSFDGTHTFAPTSSLELRFTITTSSTTYGAIALVDAIDVQVPSASVSGPTLDFTMTNLDQIGGDFSNPGYVQYTYLGDSENSQFDPSLAAPEPGTMMLLASGGLALVRRLRRA